VTDRRVAIVREWLYRNARTIEDHGTELVEAELIAALDAQASSTHPDDVVERVAKSIYNDHFPEKAWHSATAEECEDFRGHARAALEVMPPVMSDADRDVLEAADAWFSGGDFTMANGYDRALVHAVERKRALAGGRGKR
jgi:hypothetical protein